MLKKWEAFFPFLNCFLTLMISHGHQWHDSWILSSSCLVFRWAPEKGAHLLVRKKERKQLLVGTVGKQKLVLQLLQLIVLTVLYLVYTTRIISRLNFSVPVFVQLSKPLRKDETWSETLCAWSERSKSWCQPMSTHRLPTKSILMLIKSNCRGVGLDDP